MFLASHGALPRRMIVENGEMTCTVEVPPKYVTGEITRIIDFYACSHAHYMELDENGRLTVVLLAPMLTDDYLVFS